MSGVSRGLALLGALAIGALVAQAARAADPLIFDYHGWHVDITRAKGGGPAAELVDAVKTQLDIVENVQLKPQVLRFMRTIRIWADPNNPGPGPGHYSRATGVDLRVRALEPGKPIILHEFLHAYHDQKLPGGFGNADIGQFFERGKSVGWPDGAYMLTNRAEFFATTASVYLFGDIPRPPNSRKELRTKQPRYYEWLAKLFDDGRERE
jgi:hypothetical protein